MNELVSDHVRHISTSLVGFFRTTIDFFLERDAAIQRYHPEPFPNWQRSERHFNLVNANARQVIRFDPNRFVIKAEGHLTPSTFGELIKPAEELLETFAVSQIADAIYTSMLAEPKADRAVARSEFAERFLSQKSRNLLHFDELSDFAVVVERKWQAGKGFKSVSEEDAKVNILERVQVGPVTYDEIAEKGWVEFRESAENDLYKTSHAAPAHAILTQMRFQMEGRGQTMDLKSFWDFYEWARRKADDTWTKTGKETK